jgi:hypothetical protein
VLLPGFKDWAKARDFYVTSFVMNGPTPEHRALVAAGHRMMAGPLCEAASGDQQVTTRLTRESEPVAPPIHVNDIQAERVLFTYLHIYLLTFLPIYLFTYSPFYLLTFSHLFTYLFTYLLTTPPTPVPPLPLFQSLCSPYCSRFATPTPVAPLPLL